MRIVVPVHRTAAWAKTCANRFLDADSANGGIPTTRLWPGKLYGATTTIGKVVDFRDFEVLT